MESETTGTVIHTDWSKDLGRHSGHIVRVALSHGGYVTGEFDVSSDWSVAWFTGEVNQRGPKTAHERAKYGPERRWYVDNHESVVAVRTDQIVSIQRLQEA